MAKILIIGSTGYVGERLRQALELQGHFVRCLIRSKSYVPLMPSRSTDYIIGDVADKKVLLKSLQGIEIIYYLIHSRNQDRELAEQFSEAAGISKIQKIIYLSGLGNCYEIDLSPYLKSRQDVGHILRAHSRQTQVIEFRTSIVIGSGSRSFEMIRSLVDHLPLMLTPKWVQNQTQPIAVQDLIQYLVRGLDCPLEGNPIFEIGGRDKVSYGALFKEYAVQTGHRCYMIPFPFLSIWLSSIWVALVTPLYARVAKNLIESAIASTIVHDPLGQHIFQMKPLGYKEAIKLAIANENEKVPASRWNGSASSGIGVYDWSRENFGGRLTNVKQEIIEVSPEKAFKLIQRIGGESGYYFANWIWKLRGVVDFLCGGVGFRRGRRDHDELRPGDVIDFWRVASYEPNRQLKLLAEIKTPGRAMLEFTIAPKDSGIEFTQKAIFDPIGVSGIVYWYIFYPVHQAMLRGMFRAIKKKMEESS